MSPALMLMLCVAWDYWLEPQPPPMSKEISGGGESCPALPCWLPHLGAHFESFPRPSPLGALFSVPTTTLGLEGTLSCLPLPLWSIQSML